MAYPYQNLVFEGGGVKGIAYVGALEVLEQKGILPQIQRVAGTSAGSIIALLLGLRYTVAEIETIMRQLDFSQFEDHFDPLRLVTRYGLYAGDFALAWFQSLIKTKLGNANATFADLRQGNGLDLYVFSTNLATRQIVEFSDRATPTQSIAAAVRMSMSIPLFFDAVNFNGQMLVDGGVLYNYPITAFDDDPFNETLGFAFANPKPGPNVPALGYDHPLDYVKALFETLLAAQSDDLLADEDNLKRTVLIDSAGISATDFNLTEQQKDDLIANGQKATAAFI